VPYGYSPVLLAHGSALGDEGRRAALRRALAAIARCVPVVELAVVMCIGLNAWSTRGRLRRVGLGASEGLGGQLRVASEGPQPHAPPPPGSALAHVSTSMLFLMTY
jgi:hypothetical protein